MEVAMRLLGLLVLSVAFLTACAMSKNDPEAKIIPRADLKALTEQFNTAVAKDPELAAIFGPFRSTGTKRPDTEPFGSMAVNRKAWDDLSAAQRDSVVKKVAATFSALFLNSPVRRADVATVYLVEGGSDVGWFHVRAARGDYFYRLAGQ
jgi:truncated hemoglobin YjbI